MIELSGRLLAECLTRKTSDLGTRSQRSALRILYLPVGCHVDAKAGSLDRSVRFIQLPQVPLNDDSSQSIP